MRGYGLPRILDMIQPDCHAIWFYGLKSIKSRVPKHGNLKNSFRNSANKRFTRRIWKKKARAANKANLHMVGREAVE